MNIIALIIISAVVLAGALAAAFLPRLIHAALSVVLTFVGVACMYFLLGAEFVGLVQIFVYVGAVAILIVFTILLTNPEEKSSGFNLIGIVAAIAVFVGLACAIIYTKMPAEVAKHEALTVKQIGDTLMDGYVWPLMGVGLLLTAALLGALILVMEEKE